MPITIAAAFVVETPDKLGALVATLVVLAGSDEFESHGLVW
jgi:hypothetical protein